MTLCSSVGRAAGVFKFPLDIKEDLSLNLTKSLYFIILSSLTIVNSQLLSCNRNFFFKKASKSY